MTTKTVSIPMDADRYAQFSEFAEQVFIPVSALFSCFAATTVREQRIPFDVAADPFFGPVNQGRIVLSEQV